MRRWAIINGLLGLIVALLALQIVSTWARSLPRPEERPRQPPPAPAPEPREKGRRSAEKGGTRTPSPEALVAAINEKDLFDSTRRPVPDDGGPQAAAQDAAPLPPPSGVAVVGIRLLQGEREAFIQDSTQQNKQRRLRVGDQLQSFTVKEITDTQVILAAPTGQSVTMDVELRKSGGARGPAPAVPGRSPAAGASVTTITIPRPTTTSTTRPPGQRGGPRRQGAAMDLPSLNRSVEKKLEEIRKRGGAAEGPGARARPLALAHDAAHVIGRTS
jgi:hypothetical protein